jgi:hypothetical protein
MKNPFSMNWGKPKEAETLEEVEPLDEETIARLKGYSEYVLKTLQQASPQASYDSRSVEYLASELSEAGSQYSPEDRVKIANLYGAFLGYAILATYPQYAARWVRWKGDVGLEFSVPKGAILKILFPINRVFKNIDNGEADSIHSLFLAVPEFVNTKPS